MKEKYVSYEQWSTLFEGTGGENKKSTSVQTVMIQLEKHPRRHFIMFNYRRGDRVFVGHRGAKFLRVLKNVEWFKNFKHHPKQ